MNLDIVINGGGMVGASLACALKDSPFHIGLIDENPKPSINDPRLIALNHGSINFLKSINVFEKFHSNATPIHEVHISQKGRFGAIRIKADEVKLPFLGYVVPAKDINAAIETTLEKTKIERIYPAKLTGLSETKKGVELSLKRPSGEILKISTKTLIAADGTHSTIRELLSIPTTVIDYQQSAIVSIVELRRPHKHIAYERFIKEGAVAMLPLTQNHAALIWTATQSKINSLLELNDHDFLAQLQSVFGFRMGHLQNIGTRSTFPLKLIKTNNRVYGHTILIGNAAHTLHPLAAQGLNLALHEVKSLSKMILSSTNEHLEFQDFDKYSLPDQIILQFSCCLNSLFSVDFPPMNWARQLGMIGVNTSGPLKKRISMLLAGTIEK